LGLRGGLGVKKNILLLPASEPWNVHPEAYPGIRL